MDVTTLTERTPRSRMPCSSGVHSSRRALNATSSRQQQVDPAMSAWSRRGRDRPILCTPEPERCVAPGSGRMLSVVESREVEVR